MKPLYLIAASIACSIFLNACSSLGLQAPKSFHDNVANALVSVTAARDASTRLAEAGRISREDFADFIRQCDSVRSAIDTAREVHKLDISAGEDRFQAALTMLTALNQYLAQREKAIPPPPSEGSINEHQSKRRSTAVDHRHRVAYQADAVAGFAAAGR